MKTRLNRNYHSTANKSHLRQRNTKRRSTKRRSTKRRSTKRRSTKRRGAKRRGAKSRRNKKGGGWFLDKTIPRCTVTGLSDDEPPTPCNEWAYRDPAQGQFFLWRKNFNGCGKTGKLGGKKRCLNVQYVHPHQSAEEGLQKEKAPPAAAGTEGDGDDFWEKQADAERRAREAHQAKIKAWEEKAAVEGVQDSDRLVMLMEDYVEAEPSLSTRHGGPTQDDEGFAPIRALKESHPNLYTELYNIIKIR